jgi:hypothetical protein
MALDSFFPALTDLPVVPICRTRQLLVIDPNHLHDSCRPAPSQEGRFAIVTNVGRGMRWTRVVHETNAPDADDEAAWS